MTPRGIKNNNPGNIRISSAPWLGKLNPSADPEFETFSEAQYGVRAIGVILSNYNKIHGLSTLRGIINRWAPPNENDTDSYLSNVCAALDASADDAYNVLDETTLAALVAAIIHQENGQQPYSQAILEDGVGMALA